MANPNKTVGKWRQKNPFPVRPRPLDPFIEWLSKKAREGTVFPSLEEAQKAYADEKERG